MQIKSLANKLQGVGAKNASYLLWQSLYYEQLSFDGTSLRSISPSHLQS